MRRFCLLFTAAAVLVAGCMTSGGQNSASNQDEPGTPMGDKAPSFEGDWSKFIVGRWSPRTGTSIDSELAKQMGTSSINDGGEVDVKRWWKFREDGKFEYRIKAFSWKIEGTWTVQGEGLNLQYLTLDGMSLPDAQMKFKKDAEEGGAAAIADEMAMDFVFEKLPTYNRLMLDSDKKHVYFQLGEGAPDPGLGTLGGLARKMLDRVE